MATPRRISIGSNAIPSCAVTTALSSIQRLILVNKEFAWSTKILGTTMTGRHQLTATPTGTQNRLTIEMVGPTAGLLRALTRKAILKTITTENECFKRAAEGA